MYDISIVVILVAIIGIAIHNMTKPFGLLSPLILVKTHRLSNNGDVHVILRVRFRKGRVRSLGILTEALAVEHHIYTDVASMHLLAKERLPLGFDVMSKTENGPMVIHTAAKADQNEIERADFMKIDNWTEFAVSPQDIIPVKSRPKEISQAREMAL